MRQQPHEGYEPSVVYELAARVKARGIDLSQAVGPWRPAGRRSRPARIITNEHTQVLVDSSERATDVAGLLNWCGVHDLNPVPELVPPGTVSQEPTAAETTRHEPTAQEPTTQEPATQETTP